MKHPFAFLALATLVLSACTPASAPTSAPATIVAMLPTDTPAPMAAFTSTPALTATVTSTPVPTATATATLTPTRTPILTPAYTPTTIPTYQLSVLAFHDYNGNGSQDQGEPSLPGMVNSTVGHECTTGDDGICSLGYVPSGRYNLRIKDPYGRFRYILPSQCEVRNISDGILVSINGDTQVLVPLGQGYLTLPFQCCPSYIRPSPFGLTGMVDIDRRPGNIRSFDPNQVPSNLEASGPPWAYDQHDGDDFCVQERTPIVAAAPGRVVASFYEENGAGNAVIIQHPDNTYTFYAHLSERLVNSGQNVCRGTLIGYSGNTGVSGEPHVHFAHWRVWDPNFPLDPYMTIGECDNCARSPGYWIRGTGSIWDPTYP